jgi:hypothetical protein
MMTAIANADAETAIKESTRSCTEGGVKKLMTGRNKGTIKLIRDGQATWINVNEKPDDKKKQDSV